MAWKIELTRKAVKQIGKLGGAEARRIRNFLRDRVAALDDPRQLGRPLAGSDLGSFWRYRVGDYRILCELQDDRLVVLVVEAGHRRGVYR